MSDDLMVRLLATIERLTRERDGAVTREYHATNSADMMRQDMDTLAAELAKARAALEHIEGLPDWAPMQTAQAIARAALAATHRQAQDEEPQP